MEQQRHWLEDTVSLELIRRKDVSIVISKISEVIVSNCSSLMLWNLQLYNNSIKWKNVTFFRGSKHTLTPPAYFQGVVTPNPQDLRPCACIDCPKNRGNCCELTTALVDGAQFSSVASGEAPRRPHAAVDVSAIVVITCYMSHTTTPIYMTFIHHEGRQLRKQLHNCTTKRTSRAKEKKLPLHTIYTICLRNYEQNSDTQVLSERHD